MPNVRYLNTHSVRCGFTLVELTIVIVIVAALSAIAVPRFARSIEIHRANTAAERVMRDLNLARELAQAQSATLTVQFNVTYDFYTLDGQVDLDHASQSHVVRLDESPYYADITLSDFGGDASVAIDGYGQPDTGGTVTLEAGRQVVIIQLDAETGIASIISSGGK